MYNVKTFNYFQINFFLYPKSFNNFNILAIEFLWVRITNQTEGCKIKIKTGRVYFDGSGKIYNCDVSNDV